jgi:TonB family protein
MMSPIDVVVRPAVILLAGLTLSGLLRRRSAALRHCVLAGAIAGAAAVVPLSYLLPAWNVQLPAPATAAPAPVSDAPGVAQLTVVNEQASQMPAPALPLVAIVWAVGAAAAVARLLSGFIRLLWIGSRASPVQDGPWARAAERVGRLYGLKREVVLLQTDVPDLLATWGLFRPRVFLPSDARDWSDERAHVVLCHELAHVRRWDWPVQMMAEVVRVVYWFNPLVWIACARLRRDSEQACDDAVVQAGVQAHDYAVHLLAIASRGRRAGSSWAVAMPMARPSTLEGRIAAMLNPRIDRQSLSRTAFAATAVVLLAITLPAAALRGAQNAPLPVSGSVYDSSGAVLPDIVLTLVDAQRAKSQATTDSEGRFEFAPAAPGHYVLQVAAMGFRPLEHEFDLRVERDWHRDITLQVGDVQESITVSERRPARGQTSQASTGPVRVRVGGNLRPPTKLHDVKPVYPQAMRDAEQQGVVPMEATIGTDGTVLSLRVLSAQVHPDFAAAATDAVRQWRFAPTLLNGTPVEVRMNVVVTFELSE